MKHVLNERMKRLEPVDTKCYYCEIEHSTDMRDNYFVPLFSEGDRTNLVVYRSVKYKQIMVGIPRCSRCKSIHEKAATKAQLYSWGGAALIMILSILIWGVYGIFAFVVAIFWGFFGQGYLENKFVRQQDIFTKKDGAERNDTVQELTLYGGWSFTQPTA